MFVCAGAQYSGEGLSYPRQTRVCEAAGEGLRVGLERLLFFNSKETNKQSGKESESSYVRTVKGLVRSISKIPSLT